jgi:formate hydrogenlyase transcriptional activator
LQAEPLLSLAAQVGGERRPSDVLGAIVKGIAAQPGVALTRIWLRGPGDLCEKGCFLLKECPDHRECLHLAASAGKSKDQTEEWSSIEGRYFQRIPIGNRKLDIIGVGGKSILIPDVSQDKEWILRPDWAKKEGICSFAGHPLISCDKILGVFALFSRITITEQEFAWLRMFTDQAAVAISNAQAFEALERAKAGEELHAERLKQVIDLAPLHMFIWEADANVSYGNLASQEFFGPIPRMHPMEFLDLVTHPDDVEALKVTIQKAFAGEEAFQMEVRMRRHDGEYRWFRYQLNPLRDEFGKIFRWCGTRIDIDDQIRAVDRAQKEYLELQEHFNELQQIMDVIPQHLYIVDPDGTAIQSNRAITEFWGHLGTLGPKEFLNRFAHPEDVEKLWSAFQNANQTGQEFQQEARLKGLKGDYRWFHEYMVPIRDASGRVLRWCGTHIDIDDQKRAQERTQRENLVLREEVDKTSMFEEIVGTSPALQAVLQCVAKVAPSDSTVLITGETGTGKELVARAIHKRSPRASRAFVSLNCAAIPRDLIASELFGHEKGAFTGALQRRFGRFELAEGGTIFLDEIGELNTETQVALLRVLQEREFDRVGGTRPIRADVRVITATHRDLPAEVEAGAFRSDLYYRINVFPVKVPPLRERKEDIRLLVEYFIDRYAQKVGKKITSIDRKSLEHLQSYSWPGNIRELQNVIERSVILCDSDEFSVDESWLTLKPGTSRPLREDLVDQEKERIEVALAEARGRVSGPAGAAAKLGMPASTLDSKIKSLRIDKRRFQTQ